MWACKTVKCSIRHNYPDKIKWKQNNLFVLVSRARDKLGKKSLKLIELLHNVQPENVTK